MTKEEARLILTRLRLGDTVYYTCLSGLDYDIIVSGEVVAELRGSSLWSNMKLVDSIKPNYSRILDPVHFSSHAYLNLIKKLEELITTLI